MKASMPLAVRPGAEVTARNDNQTNFLKDPLQIHDLLQRQDMGI